jgi:hypothetical protein
MTINEALKRIGFGRNAGLLEIEVDHVGVDFEFPG